MQQYRSKKTYIDSNGVQHYQGVTPYTPRPGFFGNSVQYNPVDIDWKNYQSTSNQKEEDFKTQADAIREAFPSATDAQIMDVGPDLSKRYFIHRGLSINHSST